MNIRVTRGTTKYLARIKYSCLLVLHFAVEPNEFLETQLSITVNIVAADQLSGLSSREGQLFLEYLMGLFGRYGSTAVGIVFGKLASHIGHSAQRLAITMQVITRRQMPQQLTTMRVEFSRPLHW
jgi:hypothetical protein